MTMLLSNWLVVTWKTCHWEGNALVGMVFQSFEACSQGCWSYPWSLQSCMDAVQRDDEKQGLFTSS